MGSLEAMEHKSGGGASAMDRYFHRESDSVKVAQGKSFVCLLIICLQFSFVLFTWMQHDE